MIFTSAHNCLSSISLKPCSQLPAGCCNVVAAFGAHAVAHAVLVQDVAEGANGFSGRGPVVGGGGVDGYAVDVRELLERGEQFPAYARIRACR